MRQKKRKGRLMKQISEKTVNLLKVIWRHTYIKVRDRRQVRRYENNWKERKVCRGLENKDKVFYIARRREVYVGLFSFFIVFVNHVKNAVDKGYIPVIDMQNNANIYLKEEEIGHINAWEYFFKQPMGYSLQDIRHSRNIIVGSGYYGEMFPYKDANYLLDSGGGIAEYKKIVKQYFRLSDKAQEEVDNAYARLIAKEDRMLGVLARGTDYTGNRPSGHPVQPTLEQLFQETDKVMEEYHCNKIFLGTEDYNIYNAFCKRYFGKVVTNRSDFVEYHGENSIGKLINHQVADVKREGMDYLVTIVILSKCHCFIGGNTSGTAGVMLLEEGFEYKYIFDLGLYD